VRGDAAPVPAGVRQQVPSANVVVLGIAERAGKPITFWQFTRYGLVVTVVTVALAVPYLWLRYFAFT
jgi:hypothetical protein